MFIIYYMHEWNYILNHQKTISCSDPILEVVNNEIVRPTSSMEKVAEAINRSFNEIKSYVEKKST